MYNLQKFDLTGFCLPFSIGRPVLNSSSFRPSTLGPTGPLRITALCLQSCRGHQLLDFKRPA